MRILQENKMADSFSRILPLGHRESQPKVSGRNFVRRSGLDQNEMVLAENVIHSMLTLERRRAERSGNPFVLMLLDANLENGSGQEILRQAVDIVVMAKRETDLAGWYKHNAILGIIFTEVSLEGAVPITEILRTKIETAFIKHLGRDRAAKISISLHLFPESFKKSGPDWVGDSKSYSVLNKKVS
jgi:hypothetical protein